MGSEIKYVHHNEVHNVSASNVVVPMLMQMFQPKSVLDVGCGIGTWLESFSTSGLDDLIGIDGDYVDRQLLAAHISLNKFIPFDLTTPFDLQRKFDLVISLEVAEHLPESSAITFIESLTKHSDIIVFSAAIPGQGGQNHVNEQWKKYWIDIFLPFGFKPYDIIRPLIWNRTEVDWWYKQNILVFSTKDLAPLSANSSIIIDSIHPELFKQHLDYITYLQLYVNELENKLFEQQLTSNKD